MCGRHIKYGDYKVIKQVFTGSVLYKKYMYPYTTVNFLWFINNVGSLGPWPLGRGSCFQGYKRYFGRRKKVIFELFVILSSKFWWVSLLQIKATIKQKHYCDSCVFQKTRVTQCGNQTLPGRFLAKIWRINDPNTQSPWEGPEEILHFSSKILHF